MCIVDLSRALESMNVLLEFSGRKFSWVSFRGVRGEEKKWFITAVDINLAGTK